MAFSLKGKSVAVIGASGMVGQALVKRLEQESPMIIYQPTHDEWDFINTTTAGVWFESHKPEVVFMCAGLVGGIHFNMENQDRMLYENMMMGFNVVHLSAQNEVKKLIYFGSSCQYPKDCSQPMTEDNLILRGELEHTNEGYAIAKNAVCDLVRFYNSKGYNFISLVPCNLYGPNDNIGATGHVLAMLIEKHRKDNNVNIWGTGDARREFLHVDDLADAAIFLSKNFIMGIPINVGYGSDITIRELAKLIGKTFKNFYTYKYDKIKPDGMKQKLLDSSLLNSMGWKPKISLKEGLKKVIYGKKDA